MPRNRTDVDTLDFTNILRTASDLRTAWEPALQACSPVFVAAPPRSDFATEDLYRLDVFWVSAAVSSAVASLALQHDWFLEVAYPASGPEDGRPSWRIAHALPDAPADASDPRSDA